MMRYVALVALTGLMAACDGKDCDPAVEDCDTDTGGECDNEIRSVFPENGETSAYFRTTVEAKLDDAETDATLTLTGPSGDVAGTTVIDDETVIFTPSTALEPSTEYTVTVTYSCGSPTTTFTTSEVGSEAEPADIVGNTYSLDLAQGRFIEPVGVGSLIGSVLDTEILVGVDSADGTSIQLIGAIGDGGSPPMQGMCEPTIPFPEANFSDNPFFQVGPETTTLTVSGYSVTIQDLAISGAFSPDGGYIAGAALAGTIDTRPLTNLLNADDQCDEGEPRCCDTDVDPGCDEADDVDNCCDEDAICDTAVGLGISCVACTDGTGDFCLDIVVDSIPAVGVTGVSVDPQHFPGDDMLPGSTDICTISGCEGQEECLTASR